MRKLLWFLTILILLSPQAKAESLSLADFLNQVEKQNLDLTVEKASIEASEARASGIRLNPPMVGYMQMNDPMGTNTGYEIYQELPFPTKIYQDKKLRNLESAAQKEASHYRKNEIFGEARIAYFSFWNTFEKLDILKQRQSWLKKHTKLARATSRSDSSSQVHLLEIESEVDTLENDILSLEASLSEKRNNLRLFSPSLDVTSILPTEPELSEIKIEKLDSSQFIKWKSKEVEVSQAQESLKKQSYIPDLYIRIQNYNGTSSIPQSQELMVGITLPFVYFWQPKAEAAQASAQKLKAEAELQKAKIETESKSLSLAKKAQAIQSQLKILNEKLIPRAHKRMRYVDNLAPRTMEALDDHRSVMLSYLDLKTKAIDLRLEYEEVLKEVLKLSGSEKGDL